MPIYQYRCENDHDFEVHQSMADDPLTECEVCGAPARKVLRSPAIHFKGSGFYNTDYGTRKANQERAAADAKSGDGDSSGGDGGGAAKSESSGDGAGSGDTKKSGDGSKPAATAGSSSSD